MCFYTPFNISDFNNFHSACNINFTIPKECKVLEELVIGVYPTFCVDC